MLTLTLVRHTTTAHNAERRYQGHIDAPLSMEGERHARALAQLLRSTLSPPRPGKRGKHELPSDAAAETAGGRNDLAHRAAARLDPFGRTQNPAERREHLGGHSGGVSAPAERRPLVYSSDLARAARTAALAAPGAVVILDTRLRELSFGVFDGRTYEENLAENGACFRAWIDDPERVRPPGGETLAELAARAGAWLDALPRDGSVVAFTHGGPIRVIVAGALRLRFAAVRNLQVPPGEALRLLIPAEPDAPVPPPVHLQDLADGCGRRRAAERAFELGWAAPAATERRRRVDDEASGGRRAPTAMVPDPDPEITMASSDPSQPVDDRPRHPRAPRPKQRTPGPYRVPPRERRRGLVIVNTGNGKGKTTAALGLLLRAAGRDMRVAMLQFVKSADAERGEHVAARRLGVEILPLGAGFTWLSENLAEDRRLARECWHRCTDVLASGEYDVIIFDELTYALTYDWLSHEEVFAGLRARPQGTHVVITGRDATSELVEFADLVTEMREIKHPYRTIGLGAQPGIEL